MNIKKAAASVVKAAKDNPEKALAIAALLSPGLFRKLAPKVVPWVVGVVKK